MTEKKVSPQPEMKKMFLPNWDWTTGFSPLVLWWEWIFTTCFIKYDLWSEYVIAVLTWGCFGITFAKIGNFCCWRPIIYCLIWKTSSLPVENDRIIVNCVTLLFQCPEYARITVPWFIKTNIVLKCYMQWWQEYDKTSEINTCYKSLYKVMLSWSDGICLYYEIWSN